MNLNLQPNFPVPNDFEIEMFQEDLLIELSERLEIELKKSNMNYNELKEILKQSDNYMLGLKHGFADITLRELATLFATFNKYVKIVPTFSNEVIFIQKRSKKEHKFELKLGLPKNITTDCSNLIAVHQDSHTGQQSTVFSISLTYENNPENIEHSGFESFINQKSMSVNHA